MLITTNTIVIIELKFNIPLLSQTLGKRIELDIVDKLIIKPWKDAL